MKSNDVAIVGRAGPFPGALNPKEFWNYLEDGGDAIGPSSPERAQLGLDNDTCLNMAQQRRREGFLNNVTGFDADFFNLSPREARSMDPRQRLALELAWELLETSLARPEKICGKRTAVYVGAMNDDYTFLTLRGNESNLDHHSFLGTSRGLISNRISHFLGLRGPSLTIDCGQSSSLVAVHLACESIRTDESPLAIAGGFQLNLSDKVTALESKLGAVSNSGRAFTFDERADGYVRGEGGALVLLKPLHAAIADGDRIHAVIRGSAVGNSGHSSGGLTVPSVSGQVDVLRRAYFNAGMDSAQIDYVELHGTGTKIGDAIEAAALGVVFAERRHRPVRVGCGRLRVGRGGRGCRRLGSAAPMRMWLSSRLLSRC